MTAADPLQDIRSAAAAIKGGRLSATDLVRACLAQIDHLEGSVNAFISVDRDGALERAANLDRRRAAGHTTGRLDGIPFSVKDNLATRTLPTTSGSQISRSWQAGSDAVVIRKLVAAGGILLGKNNLHEFGLGATNLNQHYGHVRNPWDLARVAGGSSGGSGAAVACGEVFASIGSDSGGSIRVPASMCGVVGFKPSYGRISLRGLVGGASSIEHLGPIARTVYDAALLYEIAAGFDSRDPSSTRRTVKSVAEELDVDTRGLRVGVVQDNSLGAVDSEVAQSLSAAARSLAEAGIIVDAVSLGGLDDAPFATTVIAYSEIGVHHRNWIRRRPHDYGDDTRPLMQLGQLISAGDYLVAQRARNHFTQVLKTAMSAIDVLIMPTTAMRAPRLDGVPDEDSGQDHHDLFALLRFVALFNLAGLPAVTVPSGIDSLGLPMGIQFVAHPYHELTLLRVARAYERARGGIARWQGARKEGDWAN